MSFTSDDNIIFDFASNEHNEMYDLTAFIFKKKTIKQQTLEKVKKEYRKMIAVPKGKRKIKECYFEDP